MKNELKYILEGNSYVRDDLNATNVDANHWQCNQCHFQTYSGKQVQFLHFQIKNAKDLFKKKTEYFQLKTQI